MTVLKQHFPRFCPIIHDVLIGSTLDNYVIKNGIILGGWMLSCTRKEILILGKDTTIKSIDTGIQRQLVYGQTTEHNIVRKCIEYPSALSEIDANYESTFRSCLGTNCYADPVLLKTHNKVTRIGILAPDKSGANTIVEMLRKVGLNDNENIEVVYESHVPAYGYGKNHGWSRIIRLTRKLLPHSHALVAGLLDNLDERQQQALFDAQIRQLMRWHCRLSHVAAHTAMLTVFIDDFLMRPAVELEKMLTFSGFKAPRSDLLAAVTALLPQLLQELQITTPVDCGSSIPDALLKTSLSSISNEMKISKELTKWPCKSFRDLETAFPEVRLPLPFHALSANCSGHHVKCSVQFDLREQKQTLS